MQKYSSIKKLKTVNCVNGIIILYWIFFQSYLTNKIIHYFLKIKYLYASSLSCLKTVETKDKLPSPLSSWPFTNKSIIFSCLKHFYTKNFGIIILCHNKNIFLMLFSNYIQHYYIKISFPKFVKSFPIYFKVGTMFFFL